VGDRHTRDALRLQRLIGVHASVFWIILHAPNAASGLRRFKTFGIRAK
jgi:hypothetical protein